MNMNGGIVSREMTTRLAAVAPLITVSASTRWSGSGPGPPAPGRKSTTPMRPCGLRESAAFLEQRHRIFHFVIRARDEHGVEAPGQP